MTPLFATDRLLSPDHVGGGGLSAERFARIADQVARAGEADGLVTFSQDRGGRPVRYPMMPSLVQLTEEAERRLSEGVPLLYSALGKVLLAFRNRSDVRSYLDVPAPLAAWVDASPVGDFRVDFCRFDLVGGNADTAGVVEFNANCPGGTIFTGAAYGLWLSHPEICEVLQGWGASRAPLADRHWFPNFLLATTGHDRDLGPVAVFRKPGGNVLELDKMVSLLGETGHTATIADPGTTLPLAADARSGYLKYGIQATLTDLRGWELLLERVIDGKLRLVNPPAGRWVADNKLCLALMSDPRFQGLFSPAEREAIHDLIPYSRKAGDGIEVSELLADRTSWVIKGPYDTRGNSVYVGAEHEPGDWRAVAERAVREGWLAQAMIEPGLRSWQGQVRYQDLSIVLLNGRWAGYVSRISDNLRVNVAQGGGRQIVVGHLGSGWDVHA